MDGIFHYTLQSV